MSNNGGFPLTAVSHVAKLENEYMLSKKLAVCNNCFALGFTKPLKRCNGCHLAAYCSRECQKQHWSRHKRFCNLVQGKGKKNAYLSGLEQDECFHTLLDSYRLRVENDHKYRNEDHGIYFTGVPTEGLVWAQGDAYADFQRYLDLAEMSGVLPEWWSFETRMECLSGAVDKSKTESIFKQINEEQLLTKYGGDTTVRNALCVLAELIVGYEGKGGPTDDKWFYEFQEFLDLHPAERARLISGTVKAVQAALEGQGFVSMSGDEATVTSTTTTENAT